VNVAKPKEERPASSSRKPSYSGSNSNRW